MSDQTDVEPEVEDVSTDGLETENEAPAKKKLAGKTLVLFIILPALLLLVGGGGATMMLLGGGKADAAEPPKADSHGSDDGHGDSKDSHGEDDSHGGDDDHGETDSHGGVKKAEQSAGNGAVIQIGEPGNPSFYTMPKILVTVSNGNGRRSQLLLKLTLEANDPAVFDKVDSVLPRISDQFQMFLREMRVDDLSGSSGDYRIRRELLRRVNLSLYPQAVDAVLIEEFIVQ
ncbi:flagellar basal body-associated FliL family protein [Ponticaulis profundi]|uniref:Flagellar protein FliL n=1 Tax=Ponticaulis profundi TaxID=2665222 RepID=A0ABW1S5D6_9PROT